MLVPLPSANSGLERPWPNSSKFLHLRPRIKECRFLGAWMIWMIWCRFLGAWMIWMIWCRFLGDWMFWMVWFDVNVFITAKIEIKQIATKKCNLCPMACWTTKVKSDTSKTWAWICPKLGPEKSENWWKTHKHYPNLWSPWVLKYEEITPRSLASLVETTTREFTQWTPSVCPNM